ncbi:MAG: hypothetical protein QXH98_01380 [Candidatus Korarchaeota archaeon]|nr:hypothetical protein [Thermoproteota archaeon]
MLKDYKLARSILRQLENEPILPEIGYESRIIWFAVAKFYRELLYLSNTLESMLQYGRLAIVSFLKASMQQAALTILEYLIKRIVPSGKYLEKLGELLSLFDASAFDQAKVIYFRELFLVNPNATEVFDLLLSRGFSDFEDRLLSRNLIRVLLKRGNNALCFDFINKIRVIDPRLYFSLLGIALSYLPNEETNKKFLDLVNNDLSNFLITLWEYINEVECIPGFFPELIAKALGKVETKDQADMLAKILAVALEKCDIESIGIMNLIISKLYNLGARNGLIELALKYAINLLSKDASSSQAYLDLAINICYEVEDQPCTLRVFKAYAAAALRLGLKTLLVNAIRTFNKENKISGLQHLEIWNELFQVATSNEKFRELTEIFSSTSELINEARHKIGLESLITIIVSDSENDISKAIERLIGLSDPLYLIIAVKYLSKKKFTDGIRYILNNLEHAKLRANELGEILFAVALGSVQNHQEYLLLETVKTAEKLLLPRSAPVYASFLNEISNKIIDEREKLAIKLLKKAAKLFEESGMYWMSLNAHAIISARRAYSKWRFKSVG